MRKVKYNNGEPIEVIGDFENFTGVLDNKDIFVEYLYGDVINANLPLDYTGIITDEP